MAAEIVALDGVWKRYGERAALRGIGFSLRAGEAVGYLGPNGAGKTTTLKLLAGISRPTLGRVSVRGLSPGRDRDRALRAVGAVVETPGVAPYLRGEDLLEYVARIKGVPAAGRRAVARRAAEAMGVVDRLGQPFGSLSTGLARRMLLATALIGDPELLLLDEPTLGLDPAARQDLRQTLRSLNRGGITLLLSTHLLEDVQDVCSRVLFLREGQLVGDEPVEADPGPSAGGPARSVRLRFASDVSLASVEQSAGAGFEVQAHGPREAIVRFAGGDSEQVALLARVIGAGLPLVSGTAADSELARRYLERVGREGG